MAVLDVPISPSRRLRALTAYVPRGGHDHEEVEAVYAMIGNECDDARTKGRILVFSGDFNAEVGARQEYDNPTIIWVNPFEKRNACGDMLMTWRERKLALANTSGSNSEGDTWTYRHSDTNRRQLDFVAVGTADMKQCICAKTLADVDIGSDHWPVLLELHAHRQRRKQRKKGAVQ